MQVQGGDIKLLLVAAGTVLQNEDGPLTVSADSLLTLSSSNSDAIITAGGGSTASIDSTGGTVNVGAGSTSFALGSLSVGSGSVKGDALLIQAGASDIDVLSASGINSTSGASMTMVVGSVGASDFTMDFPNAGDFNVGSSFAPDNVIFAAGTAVTFTSNTLGFYGATPVAKAAHPVLLSDVITILQNLGLCA